MQIFKSQFALKCSLHKHSHIPPKFALSNRFGESAKYFNCQQQGTFDIFISVCSVVLMQYWFWHHVVIVFVCVCISCINQVYILVGLHFEIVVLTEICSNSELNATF